jgi:hypothetical protein
VGSADPARVPVLLVTGTVGAGKTTVCECVSGLLAQRGVPHAALDLDWLGNAYPDDPTDPYRDRLIATNLAATWPNFAAAGARCAVLARLVEEQRVVDGIAACIPGAELTVVRVVADRATRERRLRIREVGSWFEAGMARSEEAAATTEAAGLEHLVVRNDGERTATDVAAEVLAAWEARTTLPG